MEKDCPFHFESYDKEKLRGLLLYREIDGMPLFVYLIALFCFFLLFWAFFNVFFSNILKLFIFNFLGLVYTTLSLWQLLRTTFESFYDLAVLQHFSLFNTLPRLIFYLGKVNLLIQGKLFLRPGLNYAQSLVGIEN